MNGQGKKTVVCFSIVFKFRALQLGGGLAPSAAGASGDHHIITAPSAMECVCVSVGCFLSYSPRTNPPPVPSSRALKGGNETDDEIREDGSRVVALGLFPLLPPPLLLVPQRRGSGLIHRGHIVDSPRHSRQGGAPPTKGNE